MATKKYSLGTSGVIAVKKRLSAGDIYDMHWHDYIELELILSGRAEHIYNSEAYELCEGNAYIVTHHDLHAFRAVTDITLINIGFDISLLGSSLADALMYGARKKLCCAFPATQTEQMRELCELLIAETASDNMLSDAMIRALIARMVIEIIRRSESVDLQSPSLSQKALEYIHSAFKEDISLQQLSDVLSITPNYLGRIFQRDVGVSFNTYVNQVRLRYVCNLLLFSALPVKDIALMSGYSSVEYFFSVFKKHFGMTPTRYRSTNSKILTHSSVSTNSILI